ncbi:MAG: type IV secretion system DNA-binding domain-containing protein, partial [Patescibacteria group bacterium]|nr:type IV secretion system DNA-binding domain-containing protein [Patescibacteria group bacterium]
MLYLILITLILGASFFLAYQAAKRLQGSNISPEIGEGVLLAIELPKENEKTPIAAEQMFASLHGLLKFTPEVQEHLSLEIASSESGIRFYVYTPKHFKNFVEGQIYAQYPDAEIKVAEDYTKTFPEGSQIAAAEIILLKDYIFPIKTFRDFEVDPLAAITGAVGKVSAGERIWMQVLIRPVEDVWQERGHQYVTMVRAGGTSVTLEPAALAADVAKHAFSHLTGIFSHAVKGPQPLPNQPLNTPAPRLSAGQDLELKSIENKLTKMGFETKIRAVAISHSADLAAQQLSSAIASLKQFSTANLNSFEANPEKTSTKEIVSEYQRRLFPESDRDSYILNIEELASIFHLPNISVETPTIAWTKAKKGEPPLNLPTTNCTYLAETIFRDANIKFGIKRADRRKHTYIIGKTGTGKSTLIKNMIISDMRAGEGVAVLDPHGDLIDQLLDFVPENRLDDVVIFNPADAEYPVALNMLEVVDPRQRNLIASGLLDVFKKYFANSWGPRLEYLLMNCILTLLEVPNTSLLGIVRLLTDSDYQKFIVDQISDSVMKDFWNKEFAQMK